MPQSVCKLLCSKGGERCIADLARSLSIILTCKLQVKSYVFRQVYYERDRIIFTLKVSFYSSLKLKIRIVY